MDTWSRLSKRSQLLLATLCAVGIMGTTFSAANPVIKISPENVTVGITKSLSVACTFDNGVEQNFTNLYSLLMLHAKENSAHQFNHLAFVNSDSRILDGPPGFHGAFNASGAINGNGVSYIRITWQNPKEDRAGEYKCEAHGADSIGRPVSVSSTANAEAIIPNIDMAMTEIMNIKKELVDLQVNVLRSDGKLNGQMRLLENAEGKLNRQIKLLENTVGKLNGQIKQLENAKQSMFISSSTAVFNGRRRYWLTRYSSFFNPGYAQSTCQLYGGYLAELDTREEYSFVRTFVQAHGSSYHAVILGGTDEGREGYWINRHSKTQVASFWQKGQPDNDRGKEHCSCLWRDFKFAMNDCQCYHLATNVGFVCEIPE